MKLFLVAFSFLVFVYCSTESSRECKEDHFVLEELPWKEGELEGKFITKEVVHIHYNNHHGGYVKKLNTLAKSDKELLNMTLEDIIQTRIVGSKAYNLAAQIWNHQFYWNSLSPKGGSYPTGKIMKLIIDSFDSFENFKSIFEAKATSHFGSGWAWLILNEENSLEIIDTHDAINPLSQNQKPILCIDVWEHAYYLQDTSRRADYVSRFWNVVNWDFANKNIK